jgi:hypothetical protein
MRRAWRTAWKSRLISPVGLHVALKQELLAREHRGVKIRRAAYWWIDANAGRIAKLAKEGCTVEQIVDYITEVVNDVPRSTPTGS